MNINKFLNIKIKRNIPLNSKVFCTKRIWSKIRNHILKENTRHNTDKKAKIKLKDIHIALFCGVIIPNKLKGIKIIEKKYQ